MININNDSHIFPLLSGTWTGEGHSLEIRVLPELGFLVLTTGDNRI
jgi:hypothetical protein